MGGIIYHLIGRTAEEHVLQLWRRLLICSVRAPSTGQKLKTLSQHEHAQSLGMCTRSYLVTMDRKVHYRANAVSLICH